VGALLVPVIGAMLWNPGMKSPAGPEAMVKS
jgi:hypothetical protein